MDNVVLYEGVNQSEHEAWKNL